MCLRHLAFHIYECTCTLSTLKNRVVQRPKGEPVIAPPHFDPHESSPQTPIVLP